MTLEKAESEIELARCQNEKAKVVVVEAKIALQEINALKQRTDELG